MVEPQPVTTSGKSNVEELFCPSGSPPTVGGERRSRGGAEQLAELPTAGEQPQRRRAGLERRQFDYGVQREVAANVEVGEAAAGRGIEGHALNRVREGVAGE